MIRLATNNDIHNLFDWRNRKEILKLGNNKRVTWSEHLKWLTNATTDDNTLLFIIEPNAGSVRIERNRDNAIISIYLLPDFQGKGLGLDSIKEAIEASFKEWQLKEVVAFIQRHNARSLEVFKKAGFAERLTNKTGYRLFYLGGTE